MGLEITGSDGRVGHWIVCDGMQCDGMRCDSM